VRDQRLKFVTTLEKSTSTTSHRRSSRRTTKNNGAEDDFGARDEDWDIYLQASRLMDGVDSEELSELRNLYSTLQTHDPSYLQHLAHEVDFTPLSATMASLLSSSSPSPSLSNVMTSLHGAPSESIHQDQQQLYIGTERIRVSEVVWQPSLLGSTQMGLAEALDFLLRRRLPSSVRQTSFFPLRLFLTGGHSLQRGFPLRVFNELLAILPSVEGSDQLMFSDEGYEILCSTSSLKIERALDPLRDAWRGAQQWTRSFPDALHSASLHRHQYEEHGAERLHMITPRHFASNPPLPFVTL
jgi:actin-related protein 5